MKWAKVEVGDNCICLHWHAIKAADLPKRDTCVLLIVKGKDIPFNDQHNGSYSTIIAGTRNEDGNWDFHSANEVGPDKKRMLSVIEWRKDAFFLLDCSVSSWAYVTREISDNLYTDFVYRLYGLNTILWEELEKAFDIDSDGDSDSKTIARLSYLPSLTGRVGALCYEYHIKSLKKLELSDEQPAKEA